MQISMCHCFLTLWQSILSTAWNKTGLRELRVDLYLLSPFSNPIIRQLLLYYMGLCFIIIRVDFKYWSIISCYIIESWDCCERRSRLSVANMNWTMKLMNPWFCVGWEKKISELTREMYRKCVYFISVSGVVRKWCWWWIFIRISH